MPATALPIVLIHGFPLDSSMWEAQKNTLRQQGLTVITPDLPGFGAAPAWPVGQYSMDALADYVAQFITQQGAKQAIVGGFSMGGYVLLALLKRHADMVAGAMFINTRAGADSPEAKAAREAMAAQVQAQGVPAIAETMAGKLLRPQPDAEVHKKVLDTILRQTPAGVIGALGAMGARPDSTELLPDIDVPALVIAGDEDQMGGADAAKQVADGISHSTLLSICAAGHCTPLEQPEAVSLGMAKFIAAVGA